MRATVGKFRVSDLNKSFDLLDTVSKDFLQCDGKSVLLLSGPAGSGKSTFVEELTLHIRTAQQQRPLANAETVRDVVLIEVNLPTLKNPLTNLFHEALKHMGLRDAQIDELRDLTRSGKVDLIFLLDAYDELKEQVRVRVFVMLMANADQTVARCSAVYIKKLISHQQSRAVPEPRRSDARRENHG